jgi:replication-associated recombination protein RarA
MALIYLCIASGRPVILMGETGIGKTALINLMANIMEAEYDILNIHAGITERDIEEFITPWLDKMYKTNRKILLFFDEANTNPNI